MLIRFTGPKTRIRTVEGHEWSRANGWSQAVDPWLAAHLLTDPSGEFELDPDEPLLQLPGSSAGVIVELAFLDLAHPAMLCDLVEYKPKRLEALADKLGVVTAELAEWPACARTLLESYPEPSHIVERPTDSVKAKTGGKP